MLKPTDCIESDFNQRWLTKWRDVMHMGTAYHAKTWESAALIEVLRTRGCLKRGKAGLGMGVGSEPLASVFARLGATVLATDQSPEDTNADRAWNNGQLATGTEALFYESIVDREDFDERVSYAAFDMNTDEPSFHNRFDFIWHNCVVGHLGSMTSSIEHLERSADYLVNGGWLVFTTEINIASDISTIDADSDTIIWRLSDLEELQERLGACGLVADPLRLRLGDQPRDLEISSGPDEGELVDYESMAAKGTDLIKLTFGGYAITQVLLAFQKRPMRPRDQRAWRRASVANHQALTDFAQRSRDTAEYYTNVDPEMLMAAAIRPRARRIDVTAEPGSVTTVTARLRNRAPFAVFDYGVNTPFNRHPLTLATADPINRESSVATDTWHSPNRPTVAFSGSKSDTEKRAWGHHVASPGHWFEFSFDVRAPAEPGRYTERFMPVFEGVGGLPASGFEVVITVPESSDS